jgi:hypothetical protein
LSSSLRSLLQSFNADSELLVPSLDDKCGVLSLQSPRSDVLGTKDTLSSLMEITSLGKRLREEDVSLTEPSGISVLGVVEVLNCGSFNEGLTSRCILTDKTRSTDSRSDSARSVLVDELSS